MIIDNNPLNKEYNGYNPQFFLLFFNGCQVKNWATIIVKKAMKLAIVCA